MTQEQYKLIEPILDTIENEDLRELCIAVLEDFPEYIWEVAGSSSGKYHPVQDLGQGGLMRHQICVARMCNYKLELEQNQNKYNSRQRDCLRIACLVHDGRKSGDADAGHTVHDHPCLMSLAIESMKERFPLLVDEICDIAECVISHMGQWNTSKKSDLILPKPETMMQEFVHECDYLASRKDIEMLFDDWKKPELPDINEYKLNFGKHNGMTLPEIKEADSGYIEWLKENYGREPIRSLLKQL